MTQGEGIRGPITVASGGSITIDVGPNDATVEISQPGGSGTISVPVDPGKQATFPVPNVPPNTLLIISVGKGLRSRVIVVEVVAAE